MTTLSRAELEQSIEMKLMEILETDESIAYDEDLNERGLDSIRAVQLIVEMEQMFDILFDEEELLFEYYSTIHNIAQRIEGKLNNHG